MHYPKLTFICCVEHTLLEFFNVASKMPIIHQMISYHKGVYNISGSDIYHKPRSIFKPKSQESHAKNIGLFSGNYTWVAGYFMEMQRDLWMQKVIQSTIMSE